MKTCPVCGEIIERTLPFPLLDGSGRTEDRTVTVACACRRKEDKKIQDRLEAEEMQRKLRTLRSLSLMDSRLRSARLETYDVTPENKKLHAIACKYVERFGEMKLNGQGILFYGDVGTGKSFTAAAIANELLDRMHSVVMTSFVKLVEELRRFNDSDTETYLDRLNAAELLIVDDLGAERGTDYALEKVYDIVDSRYRCGKPMILTTNLEINYMKECSDIRYSRIYDRIFEMCYPVKATGKSWRKRQAVARFDEMKKMLGD